MTIPTPPEVVPAQVDREAAADLTDFLHSGEAPKSVARIRDGSLDRTRIVQAFARHRLAAIEEAAKVASEYPLTDHEHSNLAVCWNASQAIATAIRQLASPLNVERGV